MLVIYFLYYVLNLFLLINISLTIKFELSFKLNSNFFNIKLVHNLVKHFSLI